MLENYIIDDCEVIKQKSVNLNVVYDNEYVNQRYEKYSTTTYMSYLRLGFLLGSLKGTPNSILDVGYGNGDFLQTCRNIIPNCYGFDITDFPLPENIQKVDNIFDKFYDVVCFFDSLEHFEDIYFLNKLNCDYVLISVPDCHYFSDEWFKNWKHRRENEHIWHFNQNSLTKFMKNQNYDFIKASNFEDTIRKPYDNNNNILSCLFKKNRAI